MEIEAKVWFYWLLCSAAIAVLLLKRQQIPTLLSPAIATPDAKKGYWITVVLGWATTLAAAIAYIIFTNKLGSGTYHIPDLMLFSLLNGVLEQVMFVFWFLLGCWLAVYLSIRSSWKIFSFGFLSYSIYSGLIHGLFWVNVLPPHQIINGIGIRLTLLLITSFLWMWLFWRYRALMAIVVMHCAIDFLSIGHLHFAWFEPYQIANWSVQLG